MLCTQTVAHAEPLPPGIVKQLPSGFRVLLFKPADFDADGRTDYIVVTHKTDERDIADRGHQAPRRPLLIFMQAPDGAFQLLTRNDRVVYAINEGGQCDPFLDSSDGLAVKKAFFTVENGVACGQHWSDYLTFRYDPAQKNFVFHKRIVERWDLNPSTAPDAEALVLGHRHVDSANRRTPVLLQDYTPAH
jgi:hypothetical protein